MLLIYLPVISPRSEYIFEVIFNHELGINYSTTTNLTEFENHGEEKINYSLHRHKDEFYIKAASLLSESLIKEVDLSIEEKYQSKILFSNDASCDVGFDIFSATFYMLSRYEEYLPFTPDQHGRFKATESLAYKNNFLLIPVVDKWVNHFKNLLQKKFPALKIRTSDFNATITYDIDVAFKFKGRSLLRNTGATIKDLLKFNVKNIYNRIQTLYNNRKDPWDVYDYLDDTIRQNNLQSIFFFLLGDISTHDRNLHYKNPEMKKLVDKIKTFSNIGIHPSYKASSSREKILSEKERLEKLSGKIIEKSRQHFLRFSLPETYNSLINAGIREDYSMGFPGLPGFRAGTCKPFYFYDLKNEKSTELKIFPVTLMEGTFINAGYSHPMRAAQDIFNLIEAVKNVNGTFISIWHNHTVSETTEYLDWKNVHDEMIQFITRIVKPGPTATGLPE